MGSFGFGMGGGSVDISRHAKRRWRKRVQDPPSHALELDENTWHNAENVLAPEADCDEARLYRIPGERDMLLCGHHKSSKVVVSTVLYADYSRLPGFDREGY